MDSMTTPEPSLTPPRDYLVESNAEEAARERWGKMARKAAVHLIFMADAMRHAVSTPAGLTAFRAAYDRANTIMEELEELAKGWSTNDG